MAGAGEAGVAMIGVYLGSRSQWIPIWSTLLLASYWLSLIGFGLQMLFVPFWAQHMTIGVGMLISGAVVPLYALVLINRLTATEECS
jgi:hypothetical protein